MTTPDAGAVAGDLEHNFVPLGVVPDPPNKGWTKAIIFNNKWTSFEKAWMDNNLALYRQSKGAKRHDLVGWVTRQIHRLWGTTYDKNARQAPRCDKEWKRRKKSIEDYFRNHGRQDAEVKIPYHTGNLSFNAILHLKWGQTISDLAIELSDGLEPGHKDWIGYYKKAEKQIREQLKPHEKQEIEDKMKEYDAKGLPAEEQGRRAEEAGGKTLDWAHRMVFKEMGMRCITLAQYYTKEGKLQYSIHDRNNIYTRRGHPAVKTLRQMDPDAYRQIDTAFRGYCRNVMAIEKPESFPDIARRQPTLQIAEVVLPENGHVLVPYKVEKETQQYQAKIIRKIVNMEYSLAKQATEQRAPWVELSQNTPAFIQSKHLPDHMVLRDPEKLLKAETEAILLHWRHRQSRGKIPLQFHAVKVNGEIEEAYYVDGLLPPNQSSDRSQHLPVEIDPVYTPEVTNDISDSSQGSEEEPGQSRNAVGIVRDSPPLPDMDINDMAEGSENASHSPRPPSRTAQKPKKQTKGKGRAKKQQYTGTAESSSSAAQGPVGNVGVAIAEAPRRSATTSTLFVDDTSGSSAESAVEAMLMSHESPTQLHNSQHIITLGTTRVSPVHWPTTQTAPVMPRPESTVSDAELEVPRNQDSNGAPQRPRPKPKQKLPGNPSPDPPEILYRKRSQKMAEKYKGMSEQALKKLGVFTSFKNRPSSSQQQEIATEPDIQPHLGS